MIPEGGAPSPHVHQMSLDTGSTIAAFAEREIELGTGALTTTDHGSMGACREVYDMAKKKGLTPILGVEAYFRDDNCPILAKAGLEKQWYDPETRKLFLPGEEKEKAARFGQNYGDDFKYGHVTIHALDQTAYEGLGEILSHSAEHRYERHGSENKPLFDWAQMEAIGALNVTISSGCLIGMVQRHILERGDFRTAMTYYERLRGLARPGNFYVEVFPHDCSRNWVDAVFIEVAGGERIRYYPGKTVRVDKEEITVDALARRSSWGVLNAVSNYRKWVDLEPRQILKVERVEGYIENECKSWAKSSDVQAELNKVMVRMARRYGDPILLSDDAHYAKREEKIVQDVRLAQAGSWRFYGSYHRQNLNEAFGYFESRCGTTEEEFLGWVENNRAWAERFKEFKLEYKPSLPTSFYPQDTLRHLGTLIEKHGRLRREPKYMARLKAEIDLLHRNGKIDLLPYFFLCEDIHALYARHKKLPGPGRGSAAGLYIAFLLRITHEDPIEEGLSLERFITLDRINAGALPDIDNDFPDRALLDDPKNGWLFHRFGDHVAQISADSTLRLSAAAKDVTRMTRGFVPGPLEDLSKRFSRPPQNVSDKEHIFGYTADDGTVVPGSIDSDVALQEFVRSFGKEWKIVQQCLGLARGKTRHACGFVIADIPIQKRWPTMNIGGARCTQYTAKSVEKCGGVKVDLLTVSSLDDISECLRLVRERSGVVIPEEGMRLNGVLCFSHEIVPHKGQFHYIWKLPQEEPIFRQIIAGDTASVFQLNTPAAVQWLEKFTKDRPDGRPALASVSDLAYFTSLDRPGPLNMTVKDPETGTEHNMLVEYARRVQGEPASTDIPIEMARLFPETHGVMVTQEQLQRAYQTLTGCTGAEAEQFRRDVAKKEKKKIEAAWSFFFPLASAKLGPEVAKIAWQFFITFAEYGFNYSHALSYARTGYTCAWFKHHYNLEWWCAVLRNADKKDVVGKFWKAAGHLIDLPDLTRGSFNFEISGKRIVAPVSLLKGVGEKAHEQLLALGPYADLADLCQKIEKFKDDTGKWVKKMKKVKEGPRGQKVVVEKEVEVFSRGRASVNRGTIYRMLIAGTVDALLPVELRNASVLEKLFFYEKTFAEVTETKQKAVPEWYGEVTPVGRYLLRKSILPAYHEDLRPMLAGMNLGINETSDHGFVWNGYSLIGGEQWVYLNDLSPLPMNGIRVAAIAYVVETRPFIYHGSKQAIDFTLDIDGETVSIVAWPERDGKPPQWAKRDDLKGALVFVEARRSDGRDFSLVEMTVIQTMPRKEVGKGQEANEDDDA